MALLLFLLALALHLPHVHPRRDITISSPAPSSDVERQCIKHTPRSLDKALRAALCLHVSPHAVQQPGKCAYAAMRSGSGALSPDDAVLLCQRADSKAPADCARSASWRLLTGVERAKLCRQSTSASRPAKCADKVLKFKTSGPATTALCARAISQAPYDCFERVWRKRRNHLGKLLTTPDLVAELCTTTTSTSSSSSSFSSSFSTFSSFPTTSTARPVQIDPSSCALALKPKTTRVMSVQQVMALCRNAINEAPARCVTALSSRSSSSSKILSMDMSIALCSAATTDGPAHCAAAALSKSSSKGGKRRLLGPAHILQLCAGALDAGPAECYRALPTSSFVHGDEATSGVLLCTSAQGMGPAECASHVLSHPHLRNSLKSLPSPSQALRQLCQHAKNDVPAQCYARAILGKSSGGESGSGSGERGSGESGSGSGSGSGSSSRNNGSRKGVKLEAQEALALCAGATDTSAVDCAGLLLSPRPQKNKRKQYHRVSLKVVVSICQGTTFPTYMNPAKCIWACPPQLPSSAMVALCTGATSPGPGECTSLSV